MVGLLAELGATWSREGEPLFPIGSIYDPFVSRALEPWSFGLYFGWSIHPGGDAFRRHAGTRGRRAPSGDHPVDRSGTAWLHRMGARLRPRPRVDVPVRPEPAGTGRRIVFLLPPGHATGGSGVGGRAGGRRSTRNVAGSRRSAAGTRSASRRGLLTSLWSGWVPSFRRWWPRRRNWRDSEFGPTSSA